jgi:hypothetical protein
MSNTDFVDMASLFGMEVLDKPKKKKKDKKDKVIKPDSCSLYKLNGSQVIYNDETLEYYRVARHRKMDPILFQEMDDTTAFKYDKWWDPYSPTIYGVDPYGPLYFHPDNLIRNYYVNRLVNLYVQPTDDDNGYFTGYYDNGVGAGEECEIIGRSSYPERYLFRLPITDCYLTKDHSECVPTMGPKLSDADIAEIDRVAALSGNNYRNLYGRSRPSLVFMKKYYDQAIAKFPIVDEEELKGKSNEDKQMVYTKANQAAVDILRAMRG